jgi:5-(carboxyamino)imidazole ribonucleotide synthase
MAVEFFVLPNGDVFVNEIAPRVHNSGHWTLDGCTVSQFEQHVRAICGLPLASARLLTASVMENIIGDDIKKIPEYLQNKNANIYLYGKTKVKAGRKLGHVNIIANT